MPGCGNCPRAATPVQPPAPLFQIEQRYRTRWNGLTLSIQTELSQWTLSVRDEARNKTVYTAYRGSASAAKAGAAEFAILQSLGFDSPMNPISLAQSLQWQLCW
jgi:hypothetical protein